jgi:hypothetical protein
MIVSLAFLYATSANDDVVPEDNMYAMDDDLSEAHATVQEMLASGRSDKECRELVRVAKEEVKTLVKTCQDTINKLPTGQHCMDLGLSLVRKATEEKVKADKHYATCSTELTNSMNAKVNFGSRTYSSLTVGKCDTFYSHSSYVNAKMRFDAATSSKTQAAGAAAQAKKDLEAVTASHKKLVHECLCKTKKDHAKAYAAGAANHQANEAAWNKAHQIECVLDGKTKCTFAGTPRCHAAVVTAAVNSAMCVAAKKKDDCPVGYTQVGTKTKNNDYGGACLGQTFGKTMQQCEARCKAKKGCVSFMYGAIAQHGHKAGKCELCNHKKPNNSWGKDFVFCRKD